MVYRFCYFDCEDLLGLFEEILGNLLGKNVGSLMKLVFWGEERYDTLKDVIKPQVCASSIYCTNYIL